MLRSWDLDDSDGNRKREAYSDPVGAARQHLDMWAYKLDDLMSELTANGWSYDPTRWYLGSINEPDPHYLPQMVDYWREAMRYTGWPLGIGCSSVGTFGIADEPNNWSLVKPLEQAINDGGHILMVHEYWQPEGSRCVWIDAAGNERSDAYNLAWRHHSIPLDVPILIGESGANGYIYNRHSNEDDAGWRKFMPVQQYAGQVDEYIRQCDTRVKGVCLYMTDYHSSQWESFDTTPARDWLLAIKDAHPLVANPVSQTKPVQQYVPIVTMDGPQVSTGDPHYTDDDDFDRAVEFIGIQEGGLSTDKGDLGNYYNGEFVGTKYGISARSWGHVYDIPNLTWEQAKQIYREYYWEDSGADKLPWPVSLMVFDAAVNQGAVTAKEWQLDAHQDPWRIIADRLRGYANSSTVAQHGAGWMRRLADVADVMGQG